MKRRNGVLGVILILLGVILNLFTNVHFPLPAIILAVGVIIFVGYFIK